jgi:inner membrane protein
MDTLTHALSGALVARVLAARRGDGTDAAGAGAMASTSPLIGRFSGPWDGRPGAPAPWQCVVVGLLAGAFPDIDAVSRLAGDIAYLRVHRGITHSLLVAPLWAALVAVAGAAMFRTTRRQRGGWKGFYLVALAAIALHIAGDWITQFGTMLLQPLSDRRFGLGAMFIIDLAFTGLLLAGLVACALWPARRAPAVFGLLAAAGWVGIAWVGQQEALAVGRDFARTRGIEAAEVQVMPRPASPYNWTVTVFDGHNYHVAHVNTRRAELLTAGPQANFIRRFSAPYRPVAEAEWTAVPRFGGAQTPEWAKWAWEHDAFAFYRWFAQVPALARIDEVTGADGRTERCAWFRDLRFEFPGREVAPFRFGLCFDAEGPDDVRVYRLDGDGRRPA